MKYGCSIKERQTKRGTVYDARWWYYDADGEKHLGGAYGKATKRQANDAYLAFMKTYVPPKETVKPSERLLFDNVVDMYFSQLKAENAEGTIYDKKSMFTNFITPFFTGRDISKLSTELLYAWQDELWAKVKNTETGEIYSYAYKEKIRAALSALLQWAEHRFSIRNNLKNVKKPRKITVQQEMKIWEEEDFLRFLGKIDDVMWRTFFMILFYTGVRVGEANALTDAKIGNGRIIVNSSATRKTLDDTAWKIKCTKNRKNRTNKLVGVVDRQVEAYKTFKRANGVEGEFFFIGSRPLPEQRYQRALAYYCKLAGVDKIRIHDFRHSYVSMMIYFGASPALVADLIGDTLEQVLNTYGHLWKSERDRVVDLMENTIKIR